MAVKTYTPKAYQDSFRKLFPRGPYWDKQFEDPESDCSLFCKAKADLIVRIRKRMMNLQNESIVQTAEETLDSWESVILGAISNGLDAAQRRALLHASKAGSFSIETIKEIGRTYGITITSIIFPFRPAFFGHSCFGTEPIASPAAFAVLFIYSSHTNEKIKVDFEEQVISRVLSNYIVYFIYGGA
jgi:uncharacterized protein YmfQ (DUF2313 family)